jgi:hypothetical protein
MTVRIASLVCCFGVIAGVQTANAQTAPAGPDTPTVALPGPAPSVPDAKEADETEKDELGRGKWWPAAPRVRDAGVASGSTDRDQLGRSKWWPAPPDSRSASAQASAETRTEPLLPFERGVLFLPYLGLSLPLGSNSDSYATGHNFGALIGIHASQIFSLNMEINVDYMSPGPLATETQTDFALCPLIQSRRARHVLVFGAKFGRFSVTRSVGEVSSYRSSDSYSASGFVWGAILGGFVPVGPVTLGGLAQLTFRNLSSNCDENVKETLCNEGERYGVSPALTTLTLSAAALF